MADLRLSMALSHYDRHLPFFDGSVQVEGVSLQVLEVGQSSPLKHGQDRHERMLQTGDGLGFLAEAGDFFRIGMFSGQNDLERYQALETNLPSFVNAAHAAPAEHAQDFVAGNHGPIRINGSIRCRRTFDAGLSR